MGMTALISILRHPWSQDHKLIRVEVEGRVYALSHAEPFPSLEEAREIWETDRQAFTAYDETTGTFYPPPK